MSLTKAQEKALDILKDTSRFGKHFSASGFASLMWPDSTMHTKVSNTGNGATKGKGAWLCAGSYLNKLKKKGYVDCCGEYLNRWFITEVGKSELKNTQS